MRLSPLYGTATVAVVLGLLAIPLREMTGADRPGPPPGSPASGVLPAGGETVATTPAVVRFRLLRPAEALELESDNGDLLWKSGPAPAGETETGLDLPLGDGECVLHLRAEFPEDGTETAVFVTVLPDGLEERAAHAIGSGVVEERLAFSWPPHDHTSP